MIRLKMLTLVLSWAMTHATAQGEQHPPSLRVMSFNVRYGTAKDGDNHWNYRKNLVVRTIKKFDPDLLGTQEMLRFQAEFIRHQLPQYSYFGLSREPDNPHGEECGIFIRTDRFDVLKLDHFWLSEKPDVPGSKSWDSSLPRMMSWLRLRDRPSQKELVIANTHFDHRGKVAKEESAKLIRKRLSQLVPRLPVVVTGDFNASESSAPYTQLLSQDTTFKLIDTYRALHPTRQDEEGTFNGFQGRKSGGRIDWIVVTSEFKVLESEIDRNQEDGRYPSDHFPVTAKLQWK